MLGLGLGITKASSPLDPSIKFLQTTMADVPNTAAVRVTSITRRDDIFEAATNWQSYVQYEQIDGNWSLKIDRLDGTGGSVVATSTIDVYAYWYIEAPTLAYFYLSDDDQTSLTGADFSTGGSALIDLDALGITPASGSAIYVCTLTFTKDGYSSSKSVSVEITMTTS